MKISKMTFSATIPTGQYANIQPSIEISDIDDKEEINARIYGLTFLKDLYARFSTIGELKEFKIKSSADKINEIGL